MDKEVKKMVEKIKNEMVEKDWKWWKNNTKWSKRIENYAKLFKKDRKWWKD